LKDILSFRGDASENAAKSILAFLKNKGIHQNG
jgi:hypothetical protein